MPNPENGLQQNKPNENEDLNRGDIIENKPKYSLYQKNNPAKSEDLQQGDIIANNEEVRDLINQFYRHNSYLECVAYIIITQSCDLARHDGEACKTSYINLVPILPFEDVFLSLLEKVCRNYKIKERLYSAKGGKSKANELIESICSQNAWALGVFFLHANLDVKIPMDSLALLQVSYAFPANDSYDTFRKSRNGRLDAAFQGRLGWLVGNLYSRIGTPNYPEEGYKQIIELLMSSDEDNSKIPRWINKRQLKRIRDATGSDAKDLDIQRVNELLSGYDPKEPINKAIEFVLGTVKNVYARVSEERLKAIESKLKTNVRFESLFD